ncbi:MAG: DUF1614 domain-containing protein [Armatimonadetes bacterium]|nr:DUF1614 domain-containing protein [Armatimonadota bacterium]
MTRFPIGLIILVVISILIFFGVAHRVLDRMRLTDRAALLIIAAMIIGSFIDIPVPGGRYPVSINVGGAIVPAGLAVYLLMKAGTRREWVRALGATVVTALTIVVVGSLVKTGDPRSRFAFLDALWLYPLVAGIVAYLAGRSRRSAFIAATLGLLLIDIGYYFWLLFQGAPAGRVLIGGAGVFDAIVVAGVFAVLIGEIVGEVRERLQGGPARRGRPDELLEGLRKPLLAEDRETMAAGDRETTGRQGGARDEEGEK